MSNRVWLVSDTHFHHVNICKFTDEDGNKVRPWDDSEQMTRDMIEQWNALVSQNDVVYHLGDVFNQKAVNEVVPRLMGRKTLIMGNHDAHRLEVYIPHFERLLGSKELSGCILTHIPIHPSQLGRWKANIHGHLHGDELDDKRYLNVCVEHTGYAPILLDVALKKLRERGIV